MFRKPRETSSHDSGDVKPSVGRPPTPPTTPSKTPFTLARPPNVPASKMAATKAKANNAMPLPTIGRQGPTGIGKRSSTTPKVKDKGNGNIMSFFKKSEQETGLFVEDRNGFSIPQYDDEGDRAPSPAAFDLDSAIEGEDRERFNERGGSVKRRKTSLGEEDECTDTLTPPQQPIEVNQEPPLPFGRSGPFLEDSDSEHEDEQPEALIAVDEMPSPGRSTEIHAEVVTQQEEVVMGEALEVGGANEVRVRPPLMKEETSYGPGLDDFKDFEGMDDFDEDPFEEGDEYMERKYMEEQARIEAEEDEKDYDLLPSDEAGKVNGDVYTPDDGPKCPICNISLAKASEQDAGVHVNNCLDGKPTPLPLPKDQQSLSEATKPENSVTSNAHQFRKPNRAPKPGQADPFASGMTATNGGSAFNKLMSGHAESAAWAEAAAAENASRGKPSYQRTCPFYKILPGLFICVDAFRYGAVEGCQAYFLSHFHSDHYVGLTSHWSHGPIYCSKVTANLVRQQLRVDPKYVVALEFEKTVEVPNTKGVKVTMLPANHCPGSSLYLFEKVAGKRPNGDPRLQRILHCGDFRACRAHVEHPLLMPDVQDKVAGKSKEQKIDVCYLDTTYLNPKYAFPSQETVIKACADMCVSLSKHSVDESDGWEQMKRQRAGEGMAKFIRKESNTEIKEDPLNEEPDDMKLEKNLNGGQQVLATSTTPNIQQGRGRLLVVVGTYSIGKERICLGIAKALNSKIYAPPSKQRIVAALEDPELNDLMTLDPRAAQVHMTPLFEIRAETLDDYLKDYFPHFTRAVGFRPSGWNYRPPNSRFTDSPTVQTVLHSENWKSPFGMRDLVPQRGSSSRASCFGVPYSEHSSFRELTMFCCALRIEKIIPTVNVGSAKSRERMKAWCERWAVERRKNGLYQLPEDGSW